MRILFTLHGYKPAYRIGGPAVSVPALAERLARKGHDITVVTTNSNLDRDLDVPLNQPVDVEGVQVWYMRRKEILKRSLGMLPYLSRASDYCYAPEMKHRMQELVPHMNVVHSHCSFVYPTFTAARAARLFGKPFFYQQRGSLGIEHLKYRSLKKRVYLRLIERSVLNSAQALIALNESEVASYRALRLSPPTRVVPNGVDVAAYRAEPEAGFEQKWGIPRDALVILFLGRLHPTKGADQLLKAYVKIARQFPKSRLVMASPDERGLECKFRRIVQRGGVGKNVLFPGMLVGNDKLNMLARADLFCLPSLAEGFSIAVLEALASRTPVLLTPGCHFPEVEAAGVGHVVAQNVDAISAQIAELLSHPQNMKRMGARAVDFVRRNYNWDRIADQLIDVYRQGIQDRAREQSIRIALRSSDCQAA